jgi:membrane protein YdbS with pleckstrin-like domain
MESAPRQPAVPPSACPTPAVRREPEDVSADEEVDVWWGAYAGRTMVPVFVACGLVTLGVWVLTVYLKRGQGLPVIRYAAETVVGALWLIVLARTAYRVVAVNYRLTTRRLLVRWGFQRAAQWETELTRIAEVRVECRPLERLMGVGRLFVSTHDGTPAPVFTGVVRPGYVARMIQRQIRRSRTRPSS